MSQRDFNDPNKSILEIGILNLGFVWDLDIVIWNLRWPLNCNRINGFEIKEEKDVQDRYWSP